MFCITLSRAWTRLRIMRTRAARATLRGAKEVELIVFCLTHPRAWTHLRMEENRKAAQKVGWDAFSWNPRFQSGLPADAKERKIDRVCGTESTIP